MDSDVTVEAANAGDQKNYDKQGKCESPGNIFPLPFLVQLAGHPNINEEPGKRGSPSKIFPPSLKRKLGVTNDVHEVAILSRTPLAGTGHDGLSQNIPRGDITKNPNDSSSPPLSLAPPSLFPPPLGNGGDLDDYIRNPASRQPTK
jgi:hypothetical protein